MAVLHWLAVGSVLTSVILPQQRARAQGPNDMASMGHNSVSTIDGSQNPESIPDSAAYRLVFLALAEAPTPTAERQIRQQAFMGKIGLSDSDRVALIKALADFKVTFNALVAQFNATEEVAQKLGTASGGPAFLAQRDALVQQARANLANTISSDGLSKLDQYIQSEKKQMKLAGGQ